MVKMLGALGDRLLSLVVPKTEASACRCWLAGICPDGTGRECCKIGGTLWCDTCE
jgi:hypothetical protein